MAEPTARVLSLGAGVQSSCVLLMSCRGLLPRLDYAVFADTGWEPRAVYDNLAWLESVAAEHGIRVARVGSRNIKDDALQSQVRGLVGDGDRHASMPLFVLGPNGQRGMIKRQCTSEYKIRPITRFIRRTVLGLRPRQRIPQGVIVHHWYGISADESRRMRGPDAAWYENHYPLCDWPASYTGKRWTRHACMTWLAEHYPGRTFPRSACIGCPYHTNSEWAALTPDEFADAVEVDRALRKCGGMRGDVYLHRDCVPLEEVDLRSDIDRGQGELWSECCGVCAT